MKLQSWKILAVTVVIGGGAPALRAGEAVLGRPEAIICCLCALYALGYGAYLSFSESGYRKFTSRMERETGYYREKFGVFAPVAPFLPLLPVCLAVLCARFLPSARWLPGLLLILAAAYALCLSLWLRKRRSRDD